MFEHHRSHCRPRLLSTFAALSLLAAVALAGCTDADPVGAADEFDAFDQAPLLAERPAEAVQGMTLATLRRATAPYHDVAAAEADGFVSLEVCIAHNPIDGGNPLGVPFVHMDRVLDGEIDPTEPEILFYEPREHGSLRLVGVELAVPIALWGEDDPPELLGHAFHENEAEGLFGIHIWVWKHNPEGMFATGHPGVSCENAS